MSAASEVTIENEAETKSTLTREALKPFRLRTSREPAILTMANAKLGSVNVVCVRRLIHELTSEPVRSRRVVPVPIHCTFN